MLNKIPHCPTTLYGSSASTRISWFTWRRDPNTRVIAVSVFQKMSCVPSWFFEGRFQCKSASQNQVLSLLSTNVLLWLSWAIDFLHVAPDVTPSNSNSTTSTSEYFQPLFFLGDWNSTFIRKPDLFSQGNSYTPLEIKWLTENVSPASKHGRQTMGINLSNFRGVNLHNTWHLPCHSMRPPPARVAQTRRAQRLRRGGWKHDFVWHVTRVLLSPVYLNCYGSSFALRMLALSSKGTRDLDCHEFLKNYPEYCLCNLIRSTCSPSWSRGVFGTNVTQELSTLHGQGPCL